MARPQPDAIREEALRLEKWLRAVFDRLRLASQTRCRHRAEPAKPAPASDAWEVIVRLEQLMRVQKTHKEPVKNRRRVLRSAAELVAAQSLVFVPTKPDDPVVSRGRGPALPVGLQPARLAALQVPRLGGVRVPHPQRPGDEQLGRALPPGREPARVPGPRRGPGRLGHRDQQEAVPRPAGDRPARRAEGPGDDRAAASRRSPRSAGPTPPCSPRSRACWAITPARSQSYNHLRELLVGLTRSLTAAIDAKDSYTYGHSERVARIAVELGRELGLQEDELSDIYLAGLLHDIGKIGIRDEVLGKRAPLDDEEFEHIKEHVKIGYRILSGLHSIAHLLPGVLYHHERYDGKGYPEGLKGNAIPFLARILAVADSYDAMSTSRPYRVALPCERVEQILVEGADTQWEKAVVDAFVRCKERVHAIRQRGVGESLCGALDDALRKGTGRQALSSMVSILRK